VGGNRDGGWGGLHRAVALVSGEDEVNMGFGAAVPLWFLFCLLFFLFARFGGLSC
jgi:hypothetical protein